MQDGEKAYSSKYQAGNWQKELSKIVFLYGKQPNIVLFTTGYASIDNKGNKDNRKHEEQEENEDKEADQGGGESGQGQGGGRTRTRRGTRGEEN